MPHFLSSFKVLRQTVMILRVFSHKRCPPIKNDRRAGISWSISGIRTLFPMKPDICHCNIHLGNIDRGHALHCFLDCHLDIAAYSGNIGTFQQDNIDVDHSDVIMQRDEYRYRTADCFLVIQFLILVVNGAIPATPSISLVAFAAIVARTSLEIRRLRSAP